MPPEVTAVEVTTFEPEFEDVGTFPNSHNVVYEPGSTGGWGTYGILQVHSDVGVTGEALFTGSMSPKDADYLLGRNPLEREAHWHATGRGEVPDLALWDLAGKYHDAPVYELLGGRRQRLPAYASTSHGDENGGLDSPEAYADFAERCLELGYPAFKIHGWPGGDEWRDVDREVETVHAVGDRVGDEMDLMLDPAGEYRTFGDALKVGQACDEEGFFWYEDPYFDGGHSLQGNRRLREKLTTPVQVSGFLETLEQRVDFVTEGATDSIRAGLEQGITGLMKVAGAAEGLGVDVELNGGGHAIRHCMASIRNTHYYENGLFNPMWDHGCRPDEAYADGLRERLDAVDEDGTLPVPEGPGLGVEFDWSYVRDRQVDHRVYE